MVGQTALVLDAPRKVRVQDRILATLQERNGGWVHAEEFLDGRLGYRLTSYSQRIGDLRKEGHRIESECHGGLAKYRYLPTDSKE